MGVAIDIRSQDVEQLVKLLPPFMFRELDDEELEDVDGDIQGEEIRELVSMYIS